MALKQVPDANATRLDGSPTQTFCQHCGTPFTHAMGYCMKCGTRRNQEVLTDHADAVVSFRPREPDLPRLHTAPVHVIPPKRRRFETLLEVGQDLLYSQADAKERHRFLLFIVLTGIFVLCLFLYRTIRSFP